MRKAAKLKAEKEAREKEKIGQNTNRVKMPKIPQISTSPIPKTTQMPTNPTPVPMSPLPATQITSMSPRPSTLGMISEFATNMPKTAINTSNDFSLNKK